MEERAYVVVTSLLVIGNNFLATHHSIATSSRTLKEESLVENCVASDIGKTAHLFELKKEIVISKQIKNVRLQEL